MSRDLNDTQSELAGCAVQQLGAQPLSTSMRSSRADRCSCRKYALSSTSWSNA